MLSLGSRRRRGGDRERSESRPPRALPYVATATHAFAQYCLSLSLSHPDAAAAAALVWALLAFAWAA